MLKILLNILLFLVFTSAAISQTADERVWIFFTDKGPGATHKMVQGEQYLKSRLSSESVKRRIARTGSAVVDITDLPVYSRYIETLEQYGIEIINRSRWLNGVSTVINSSEKETVAALPFVKSIRKTGKLVRKPAPAVPNPPPLLKTHSEDEDLYGASYLQNRAIDTITLHKAGISGKNVLVGVIDDGFTFLNESLDSVQVIAEYDFIHGDNNTAYDPSQDPITSQGDHGTTVLSTIAGYEKQELIGAAYGAVFALAKTEVRGSETPVEEDYWVAGAEWLDSVGVDIITTSVGYNTFDDPVHDYQLSDMDGNTALTTIAGDIAASKGIIVITSAGNEGNLSSWGIITSPGDGDSVLAVGGTYLDSTIINYSSRGPTADGRIKPDFVAPGASIYTAHADFVSVYQFSQGTSYACPLAAGVAALLLSAHPELTWGEVVEALKMTASQANSPDNDYGWGMLNAYAAVSYHGPAFSNLPVVMFDSEGYRVTTDIVSSNQVVDNSARLYFTTSRLEIVEEVNMTKTGETEYNAVIPYGSDLDALGFYFKAEDGNENITHYPDYESGKLLAYQNGVVKITHVDSLKYTNTVPVKFSLHHNYPNPFNSQTNIVADIPEDGFVEVAVFSVTGSRIRTIYANQIHAKSHTFVWDGTNDAGIAVSSGMYICRVMSKNGTGAVKMLLLR